MSTRWYPIYQKGNPQLRVFLPNFWLKLVKPTTEQPKNVVQFHCSMEMTKYDIKNYLEKIYKIPVIDVRTRIALGKTKRDYECGIIKEDDVKMAYVVLPKTESFTFPDMFVKCEDEEKEVKKERSQAKDGLKNFLKENKTPGFPGWFKI